MLKLIRRFIVAPRVSSARMRVADIGDEELHQPPPQGHRLWEVADMVSVVEAEASNQ